MQHITVNELIQDLKGAFTRVSDDREPLAISLDETRAVVVVDLDDYNNLMETFYLLSNPANAERLREGIIQHREGKTKEIDVTAYLD